MNVFSHNKLLTLESGITLPGYYLAYNTYGTLNETRDNVIWVFHALTANSDPADWWSGLFGAGKLLDPNRFFIICVNMPGSCYGSIGPLDIDPRTTSTAAHPFFHDFPFFTPRDMARAYAPLLEYFDIKKIHFGIGGSMGGQQLLEWAVEAPDLFNFIFPIATNAVHSPWGIAFNASQRLCIEADSTWKEDAATAGMEGMKVARSVALISYRNYNTYQLHQSESTSEQIDHFRSDSYQRYQGEKLARRFNAFSYYALTRSMDSHNLGRGRSSIEGALTRIKARTLVIGIHTDILFPPHEQQFIADHIPGATCRIIDSVYGHDGFLLEHEQIQQLIRNFMLRSVSGSGQTSTSQELTTD